MRRRCVDLEMAPVAVSLDDAEPKVGVVTLLGEHDAYSAGHIEAELALLRDAAVHVVLDLTDATFVDSQTLSVLLGARHAAADRSLGFVLVLRDDDYTQVRRILEMTGLISAFVVEPTLERALAASRCRRAAPERLKVA
jgi:anti-anti-sigma factor